MGNKPLSKELQELVFRNSELFAMEILKILYANKNLTDKNYGILCQALTNNKDFISEKFKEFKASDNYIDLPVEYIEMSSGKKLSDAETEEYFSYIKLKAATTAFSTLFPS